MWAGAKRRAAEQGTWQHRYADIQRIDSILAREHSISVAVLYALHIYQDLYLVFSIIRETVESSIHGSVDISVDM